MSNLLAILTSIALVNSVLFLPTGITGIAASLATQRPFLTAIAFVAGKFTPHFLFGLLIAVGLDAAFDSLKLRAREAWQDPDYWLVAVQLIIGIAMIVVATLVSRGSKDPASPKSTKPITPLGAFSVSAGMTLVGLPGALLYFAAIDQVLRANLTSPGVFIAILHYNLVLVSPLLLVVLLRRLLGGMVDPLFAAISRFFERWGKKIVLLALLGVGTVLALDAIGWFIEFPLLPSYLR
jgi:cytochrome c biogenesis protein CcdA